MAGEGLLARHFRTRNRCIQRLQKKVQKKFGQALTTRPAIPMVVIAGPRMGR